MKMAIGGYGGISGLSSGMDWGSLVNQLMEIERRPAYILDNRKGELKSTMSALQNLNTMLASLRSKSLSAGLTSNIAARSVDIVGGKNASVIANADAAIGNHNMIIYQLATTTKAGSTGYIGNAVDVDEALSAAGFRLVPTEGTFTINGSKITIDASTTLSSGANSITELINSSAAGIAADVINDSSGRQNLLRLYKAEGGIAAGAGSDTSNFLRSAYIFGTDAMATWTSGIAEGAVENTIVGDISGDATITFTYAGQSYTTSAGSISAATANMTSIEDVASEIENAMNESLGNSGSVSVRLVNEAGHSNGMIVVTDNLTGNAMSINGVTGTQTDGLSPLLITGGATQGETIISASNMGQLISDRNLYDARLTTTLMDAVTSGIVESSANEGKAGFELAGTETVSFQYQGVLYTTQALDAVVKDITDLADAASDLENKMNEAIGVPGSVTVSMVNESGKGNNRFVITDNNPTGGDTQTLYFTSAPEEMKLTAESGALFRGFFNINGVNIHYDKYHDTVNSIVTRINASNAGVSAYYDSVSDRFNITSRETGSAQISIQDVGGNLMEALKVLESDSQTLGQNSRFSIDTVNNGAVLTRSSNNITGVVNGLTINLTGVSEKDQNGSYIRTEMRVTQSTGEAVKAVNEFISQYNSVLDYIEKATAYDFDNKMGSPLTGDRTARDIAQRLRSLVSGFATGIDGEYRSLTDIGINTGRIGSGAESAKSGRLSLDQEKFLSALQSNPEAVAQLLGAYGGEPRLQAGGTGSVSAVSGRPIDSAHEGPGIYRIVSDGGGNLTAYWTPDGGAEVLVGAGTISAFGANTTLIPGVKLVAGSTLKEGIDYLRKDQSVTGAMKSVENYLLSITQTGGTIDTRKASIQSQVSSMDDQIDRILDRLEIREQSLRRQFIAMEQMIASSQSTSAWLSSQIATMNSMWSSGK